MRLRLLLPAMIAVLLAGAPAALAANVVSRVSPAAGGVRSAFVVHFTKGLRTDAGGGDFIEINVSPPEGGACAKASNNNTSWPGSSGTSRASARRTRPR